MPVQSISCPCHIENPPKMPSAGQPSPPALFVFSLMAVLCFSRCAAGSLAQLSSSSNSISFGSVTVGGSSTHAVTLTNKGPLNVHVSQAKVQGAGFSISGLALPLALGVKGSTTFTVEFHPEVTGRVSGSISIGCAALCSTLTISLSGTGTSGSSSGTTSGSTSPGASLSPTSLSFGDEPIDVASPSQTITLQNTGGAALSVTSIALTGADAGDFTENNTCGASVAAGGSCTIAALFTPSASGSRTASLSITDNASGSPQTVALSGTGMHDVILTWTASSTYGLAGYNVYRGTTSGGESTTPLNSAPVTGTTYDDMNVQAGQKYYYKITAVSLNETTQSGDSNEVSATVPSS